MAIHSFVLDPARAPDRAHLDITTEPGMNATFDLYPTGGTRVTVQGTPVVNGFTTSADDLIAASGNRLTLVIATTMDARVASQAILRGGRLNYPVPPMTASCGHEFAFPLEGVGRGAWLYIATPNGSPATGSVYQVNSAGTKIGTVNLDAYGVQILPLSVPHGQPTRICASVQSVTPVLCQLLVQRAQGMESMVVLPIAPAALS